VQQLAQLEITRTLHPSGLSLSVEERPELLWNFLFLLKKQTTKQQPRKLVIAKLEYCFQLLPEKDHAPSCVSLILRLRGNFVFVIEIIKHLCKRWRSVAPHFLP
jgi:hypothetical protein